MGIRRRIVGISAAAAMSVGLMAGPAAAQPFITGGLVNVTVNDVEILNDVNVGLGIAAAANVCGGVNVAALVSDLQQDGTATCNSEAGSVMIDQE